MVRKVEVTFVDDFDGKPADETISFALDGTSFEIDLSAKRADAMRTSLAPYITSARRLGRGGVVAPRRAHVAVPVRNDRAQNKAIREWAKRKKIALSDRGRIPQDIIKQYEAEAGR